MIILLKIKQFLKMSDNEEDFFCGERSTKENRPTNIISDAMAQELLA